MNAYFVQVENVPYIADYAGDQPRYEYEDLCEIIIAQTPGKAKFLFSRRHSKECIEWEEIHALKIVPVQEEPQIVSQEHPLYDRLWELLDEKIIKMRMMSKIETRSQNG
jgi:hypothetical protein